MSQMGHGQNNPPRASSAALSITDDLLHRNILLLRATCRLMQCSKQHLYSITLVRAGEQQWCDRKIKRFRTFKIGSAGFSLLRIRVM
jgi:hypothetical protein